MIHLVCSSKILCLGLCLFTVSITNAGTLNVGPFWEYLTLSEATDVAVPGDTILIHEGIYGGGIFVSDLQGTDTQWIYIHAASGEEVIFDGGTNAWQFTDAAYLHVQGLIFQHQTGNGLNFDDGGTYDSPAHHVIFENCTFRDMNASGNNDLLKLSGLDDFEVKGCTFLNGAEGGSGIDMVGCHNGLIIQCHFENLGSNSIQAKGGTSDIRIEASFFKHGGARALNLGGSTGLQFFRPIDAPYEAARLKVYSNVFIGSLAPVAFVGSIECEFFNNTIYLPEKWVMRILQETVDETRFAKCGYNSFRNNIIYIDHQVTTEVNIGPDTAPETFIMSDNLWYHSENSNWTGPVLPVNDVDNVVGVDPLFVNATGENFDLQNDSPAIGIGFDVPQPQFDFERISYLTPRSVGAFEGGMAVSTKDFSNQLSTYILYPNPSGGNIQVMYKDDIQKIEYYQLVDFLGQLIWMEEFNQNAVYEIYLPKNISSGFYNLIIKSNNNLECLPLIVK